MNRGSSHVWSRLASLRSRFNEAPIHESGKCSRKGRADKLQPRFNEAPIHESGK